MSEAARFVLPPLAMAIEQRAFEAFLAGAKAGDRIVYARGAMAPRYAASFRLAGELGRAGRLQLNTVRSADGREFEWIAIVKAPSARDDGGPSSAPGGFDASTAAVLRAIGEAVARSLPCPTNAELAAACGLADADAASYRLRKLVRAGAIRIDDNGPTQRRIATIVATGRSTVAAPMVAETAR